MPNYKDFDLDIQNKINGKDKTIYKNMNPQSATCPMTSCAFIACQSVTVEK